MAKSIFIDGVWAVMNFNSGLRAYHANRELGPDKFACCFCHKYNLLNVSKEVGTSQETECTHCGRKINYLTLWLSEKLTRAFDVRSGLFNNFQVSKESIMHIVLPKDHPEFYNLIKRIERDTLQDYQEYIEILPFLYIVGEVINRVADNFRVRIDILKKFGVKGDQTTLTYNIYQRFLDLGKVIFPTPIDYFTYCNHPPLSVREMCAIQVANSILDKLEHLGDKERKSIIQSKLYQYCFDMIVYFLETYN